MIANEWVQTKADYCWEYLFYSFYNLDKIKYKIEIDFENGIDHFVELNDRFQNYRKFLKIENKTDLELKTIIVKIKFTYIDMFSKHEVKSEKRFYSKMKSLNESLEEKDFYVFDLAPGGRSIEWGKLLSEEIEDYVNLCKKQVELWEE